jgi:small conductance mechanosensitive channel
MLALALTFLIALAPGAGAFGQGLPSIAPAKSEPAPAAPAAAPTPVPLRSPDRAITRRLTGLFAAVHGLESVRASVKSGVVTLTGSVLSEQDAERAESIAGRVQGVVSVENGLVTERRLGPRLEPLLDRVSAMTQQSLSLVPLLFLAVIVFLAFWYAGRRLAGSTRLFKRLAPNAFIQTLLEQFVRLAFIVAGLLAALSIVGATAILGSVLGAAGLLGLAVGFAVRDTIENYLAGVLLSIRQPFAPNDHVVIEDFDGRITRLTSRVTVITTWDGNEVQIPNATVYKANIINFSKTADRRFEFELPMDLGSDASCGLAVVLGSIKAIDGVLADPAPSVVIDRIEGSALVIKAFGWIDQNRSDFGKVKGEAIRCAKTALEDAGILLATPIQTVRIVRHPGPDNTSPIRPGQGDAAPAVKPAPEDLRAIEDTRVDDTIRAKVHALRGRDDGEDLLNNDRSAKSASASR